MCLKIADHSRTNGFEPKGLSTMTEPEATIMDVVSGYIPIRFDCGGKGLCAANARLSVNRLKVFLS